MKLYRAFATVGGLTMVSRALGFVRDISIAAVLGTGPIADAFFVAFRFPNLFRRLFGEGAFNAAFVPLFAKKLEGEGAEQARRFAEQSFSVLLYALLIVTAVAELSMPWLMYAIAPGFSDTPEKFDLAILLTRIAFPYLLCMSLVALLSGLLNSLNRFVAAAAAPIALNIVLISVIALAYGLGFGNTANAGIMLAWGVAVAGVVQLLLLAIAAKRAGMGIRFVRPRLTPDVRRLLVLGIPGVIAGGITQVNILVGTIIASLEDGAVSYLYYADRIYQLPLGVVGIAIGVVLLPEISRKLRAGEMAQVHESQNRSLEFSMLLTLPAAVALITIPEHIIRVLFERGAFSALDTHATAAGLAAFAAGLPAFVLIKVFSPAFFAREDTRTPMIYAGISVAVNIVASLALFQIFRSHGMLPHVGIAIATTIASWLNALMLYWTLAKRGLFKPDARLYRRLPLILLASLAMGAGIWLAGALLAPMFASGSGLIMQVLMLGGLVALGLAIFAVAVQITGAAHLPDLLKSFKRGR